MSLIVAGRFETFEAGEQAAQALFARGFLEQDVTLFFVNPPGRHDRFPVGGDQDKDPGAQDTPKGAGRGVGIGAVVGAIVGLALFMLLHVTPFVIVIAVGVGAWLGSLYGAVSHTHKGGNVRDTRPREPNQKLVRDSGVLLAAHVTAANSEDAAAVLQAAGAMDIERADGRWSQGRWSDFDPLAPPKLAPDTMSSANAGNYPANDPGLVADPRLQRPRNVA